MFRTILAVCTTLLVFTPSSSKAQFPETIQLENKGAGIVMSNFRWMTTQKTTWSAASFFGQPVDPQPFDSSRLYPPRTWIYLFFDYQLTVKPSDEQERISKLYVSLHGAPRSKPFQIKARGGTGFIGLGFGTKSKPRRDVDLELRASLYGSRVNGQNLSSGNSSEVLKVTISVDGETFISQTQFEAIKAMYRRLELLERRFTELESRK
ncbi:hypothetical protein [Stieleria mannarensis]|uniref:hypothetical protein n=1 Tax=Stieleria mannarensis TaxID=2755585 RepID=UPI0015FF3017|nr:hypothetical protein [Rhodopirellula sp. JC639]